ncbi:MAG: manganese efflux pump [Oscillospiraceae bacterium]|nr:manganese efflux pump [Oscillospiraceae bacterium]
MNGILIFNSLLLGAGLAMDAFTVSLANGLNEPDMPPARHHGIAGLFAGFQAAMPLLGWLCVRTVASCFSAFEKCIPWIALLLLSYIGIKMLIEGLRPAQGTESEMQKRPGFRTLITQGIATSIDALSVGFTIADYSFPQALLSAGIIGAVTDAVCLCGLVIGKKAGMRLAGKASVVGGLLLIGIGAEIFISHMLA